MVDACRIDDRTHTFAISSCVRVHYPSHGSKSLNHRGHRLINAGISARPEATVCAQWWLVPQRSLHRSVSCPAARTSAPRWRCSVTHLADAVYTQLTRTSLPHRTPPAQAAASGTVVARAGSATVAHDIQHHMTVDACRQQTSPSTSAEAACGVGTRRCAPSADNRRGSNSDSK